MACASVLPAERLEGVDANLVVGESKHEAQHKVGFIEREHAIVDDEVSAALLVKKAYSGVSVHAVHLLARSACQQAYLY